MHRLEEAGKQAERRVDRAEARAADLQHDLHQAEQRAHQVLLCPALPLCTTQTVCVWTCQSSSISVCLTLYANRLHAVYVAPAVPSLCAVGSLCAIPGRWPCLYIIPVLLQERG